MKQTTKPQSEGNALRDGNVLGNLNSFGAHGVKWPNVSALEPCTYSRDIIVSNLYEKHVATWFACCCLTEMRLRSQLLESQTVHSDSS